MKFGVFCLLALLLAVPNISSANEKDNSETFVFYYFMDGIATHVSETVPAHVKYWKSLKLEGYGGGPFGDRSGGMITFKAKDMKTARTICAQDPFARQGLIGRFWIKKWLVHH
ncbi:YciI family protein [Desulfovibrio sp. JC010]|uniref:YciI family protein n=1 Tax=Desulfovibrio sp. JC010 TaxID=2593641 RepID=UPI0013D86D17|nr:YciI family protein [Desulfovibrio sp. JC010]NDV28791.1 hypothetical protein [Desulfovibrio sp. JC010]